MSVLARIGMAVVAFVVGAAADLALLVFGWQQPPSPGDLRATLFYGGIAYVLLGIPALFALILLLKRTRPQPPLWSYLIVCTLSAVLPTGLLLLIIDGSLRQFFSPEAAFFLLFFGTAGLVFGLGSWLIDHRQRALVTSLYLVALILIMLAFSFNLIQFSSDNDTPHRYLLPEGYTGWIEVVYGQSQAPALQEEDGWLIIPIPETGIASTSNTMEGGPVEFQYVDKNGKRIDSDPSIQIQGGSTGSGEQYQADGTVIHLPVKERLFIGTEEQWNNRA